MTVDMETLKVVQAEPQAVTSPSEARGKPVDDKKSSKLDLDKIARPTSVIHPALDWVNGQLVVGVVFQDGHRAALTSQGGLVEIAQIGPVCERDGNFDSPVTPEMAKEFVGYLETKPATCPREGLQALLVELAEYFRRFVVFPEEYWASVMASWTFATYLFPMFQAFPYLWLTSDQPGCGKSLLGLVLANLSFNGELMSSPTEANMFHLPEQNRGVQVWDEVEFTNQIEKSKFQSIKAVFLAGYRNGGVVPRQVGRNWDKQVKYHVFCPRVLIGLSLLPETARQRSIELRLRKRTRGEEVDIYRLDERSKEEASLRAKCVLTALKCAEDINRLYRDVQLRKELESLLETAGREVDDVWLPLFAIARSSSSRSDAVVEDLRDAARELIESRDREASSQPWETTSIGEAERTDNEETYQSLAAALSILNDGPVEPAKLAERVSGGLEREVTPQFLSKSLQRLGVRSRKQNGRRVFDVPARALEIARTRLAACSPVQESAVGQQGQDGQQHSEEAEHVLIQTT
jgi:hypothetical protein